MLRTTRGTIEVSLAAGAHHNDQGVLWGVVCCGVLCCGESFKCNTDGVP